MDELVRWLGEQLDADAAAAREAIERVGDGRWAQRNVRVVTVADRDREVADYVIHECIDHIVRHDPARVLREIEAKRDLLRLAERAHDYHETFTSGFASALEGTLRRYALAYSGRPGFRKEWAS